MALVAGGLQSVTDRGRTRGRDAFRGEAVHAVAGIGNPERFFETLRNLGYRLRAHPFPDHHSFTEEDLRFEPSGPVVMTEKDAVKCRGIAPPDSWYLPVRAAPDARLGPAILERLQMAKSPPM